MKLTHLAIDYCNLTSIVENKKRLIALFKKCFTIIGIQCDFKDHYCFGKSALSYFRSLEYCYIECRDFSPAVYISLDILKYCGELKYVTVRALNLRLILAHNSKLQEIYIQALVTDVPDDFMTTVSAHGGLVHVAMEVRSLTADGIKFLVNNSPKLTTLHLRLRRNVTGKVDEGMLKIRFSNRKVFTCTPGYCNINYSQYSLSCLLQQQKTNCAPLWN